MTLPMSLSLPEYSLLPSLLCFLGGTVVKKLPADARDTGSIPGLGRTPGVANGNPTEFLAWKIPWAEELGGLQSMRSAKN